MFPLNERIALVNGGSRGIGAAIAKRLSADGATVIITYLTSRAAAGDHMESLRVATALKRLGDADEVAGLVSYLASPSSAYVIGATFNIDGGTSA